MADKPKTDYDNLDELLDSVFRIATIGVDNIAKMNGTFEIPTHIATEEDLDGMGFYEPQIEEIKLGREAGVDVRSYAKEQYNWRQMREIRLGLEEKLDIMQYSNPNYSASQMKEIRLGLKDHLDVSEYNSLMNSASDMRKTRIEMVSDAYARSGEGYAKEFEDELTGIHFHCSDDYLTVYAFVPGSKTDPIRASEVRAALVRNGIKEGYREENIVLLEDKKYWNQDMTVAEGLAPHQGEDGYFEFFFPTHDDETPVINVDGSVNYSGFVRDAVVERGSVIAIYHPAQRGIPGHTVNGIPLRAKNGKDIPPLRCADVMYNPSNGKYVAKKNGCANYSSATNTIRVADVYIHEGNANYYSKIDFNGDVHVLGNVDEGAVIRGSGNILVDGFVGKASIVAGGNLVIKGGVNNKDAILRAGGKIQGHFFENATLVAGGDVASTYFSNCNIQTYGSVVAIGDNSRIIGGNIRAARKAQSSFILPGSKGGSLISVGDVGWLSEIKTNTLKRMEDLEGEIKLLEATKDNLLEKLSMEKLEKDENYNRVRAALSDKSDELTDLAGQVEHLESVIESTGDSCIIATSKISMDVVISIGGIKTIIPQDMGKARLTKEDAQKLLLLFVAKNQGGDKKRR